MKQLIVAIAGVVLFTALLTAAAYAGDQYPTDNLASNRFTFTDQTVKDKRTSIIWTRDANLGTGDWQEAVEFVKQLNVKNYAGYGDWRLPSIEELKTLQAYAKGVGCDGSTSDKDGVFSGIVYQHINRLGFFDVQDNYYWSSSAAPNNNDKALVADMHWNDKTGAANKKKYTDYNIWPVRAGN